MKFNAGYLGVCVVVMSLFGGLILGMVLNVDSETVSTTGYKYTTDITGLFESSEEPYYTNYNPAANYYGYKNPNMTDIYQSYSGINYNWSRVANNYPVMIEPGTTSAGASGAINQNSSIPTIAQDADFKIIIYDKINRVNQDSTFAAFINGGKLSTLYDWVNSVWGYSSYEQIIIYPTYPEQSAPVTQVKFIPNLNGHVGDGFQPTKITINTGNKTAVMESPDYQTPVTSSLYDVGLYWGAASQEESYFYFPSGGGWELRTEIYDTILSLNYTSQVTTGSQYSYMNPAGGVSLLPASGTVPDGWETYSRTVWMNSAGETTYNNGAVEILLKGVLWEGLTIRYIDESPNSSLDVGLMRIDGGWIMTAYGNIYQLGDFSALTLKIDLITHRLSVYPVMEFSNFTTYERADGPVLDIPVYDTWDSIDKIEFMQFHDYGPDYDYGFKIPLTWTVVNTWVLMDTHDSVLIDPSIDLSNYWPDMGAYRYYVQSVALYGDSITINNITYSVSDKNTIEINNRDYQLTNFYLSYAIDNHVYITFKNQSKTIDLGEITDKTLSFDGVWFFSMSLYEGFQTTEEVYNWVPAFTGGADMLILLGLAILGITCVALVKTGHKFKMWDYIIIGAGALILLLLLGAL